MIFQYFDDQRLHDNPEGQLFQTRYYIGEN